jgi:hypothetical protein
VLDLKLGGDFARLVGGDVRDRNQTSLRHETADVLRMPFSHHSNSKHANSQFAHAVCLSWNS